MGLWFWRFEEGVGQLPHPHGYRGGDDRVFRVHHGVKQRLQVGLRVAPYVDDLVSGRRVVLAWIHCPKTLHKLLSVQKCLGPKLTKKKKKRKSWSQSPTFFSTQMKKQEISTKKNQ